MTVHNFSNFPIYVEAPSRLCLHYQKCMQKPLWYEYTVAKVLLLNFQKMQKVYIDKLYESAD